MLCTQLEETTPTTQYLMSSQSTTTTPTTTTLQTTITTTTTTTSCCESGRPVLADPLTGQTVCSCQYDSQAQQLLNYQRLASSLPLNAVYSAPYAEQSYLPFAAEQSAFYSPTDNLGTWPYPASVYYPYDPSLSGYPFANGRKNATRETTSTLKAWLSEHRKNPYPTKGEKIMLAIITKMTLTQVSTWFANARRRLKKENKVTWEPRNRVDDDDDAEASDTNDRPEKDKKTHDDNGIMKNCNRMTSGHSKGTHVDDDDMCLVGGGGVRNAMDTSHRDSMSSPSSSILSDSHSSLQSPLLTESPGNMLNNSSSLHDSQVHALKPRIWSIVDTATSHNNSSANGQHLHQHHFQSNNNYMYNSGSGHLHSIGFGVPGSSFHFGTTSSGGGGGGSMNTLGGGSPTVKVSQQLARNLRLGYASPYTKTAWLNGAAAFANVGGQSTSVATPQSSALSSNLTVASNSMPYHLSVLSSSVASSSSSSSSSTSSTLSEKQLLDQSPDSASRNLHVSNNVAVKPNGGSTTIPSSSTTHHPITLVAPVVHSSPSTNPLGRTYVQTLQNLSHLSKGLNHLMTLPQPNGSFVDPKRSPPLLQDQRSAIPSSPS